MCIFVHGAPDDCRDFMEWSRAHGEFEFKQSHCDYTIAEELLPAGARAAVVLSDGAAGMEAAMIIRRLCPQLPLIWFSDDSTFAVQAYRLDAAYFAQKTHMKDRVACALKRAGVME